MWFRLKRDKHLTEQLKKIYGSTFSVDSEINPLTPEHGGISKRFPSSLMNNGHGPSSPLSNGMFIGEQHRRRSGLGLAQISARTSPLADGQDEGSLTRTEEEETAETGTIQERKVLNVEPAILMEQLLSVQSLLERFEKRLLVRESELIKKEREAAEQMEKLQLIVRE